MRTSFDFPLDGDIVTVTGDYILDDDAYDFQIHSVVGYAGDVPTTAEQDMEIILYALDTGP